MSSNSTHPELLTQFGRPRQPGQSRRSRASPFPLITPRLLLCPSLHHPSSPIPSPTPPNPHNPASLLPAPLAGRPEPFHLALASPWTGNTAQAPHRRAYRNIPVPPINGMPLPSKREPDKRAGSLLIRRMHRRDTPKFCSSQLDGTQSRGDYHRGSAATGVCACRLRPSRSRGGRERA